MQDTFFKAFRGLDGWRGDGSFRGWLFRIAGNLLKDRFRQNKGRVFLEIEEHDMADLADPAGELAAKETGKVLEQGLLRLPRLQREVFLLRVQQGLDYAEIAVAIRQHGRGGAGTLSPRGEAAEGVAGMTECEAMRERMPDVAHRVDAWTDAEAAHLTACGDCALEWRLVQVGAQLGSDASVDVERIAERVTARLLAEPAESTVIRRLPWRGGVIGLLAAAASVVLDPLGTAPSQCRIIPASRTLRSSVSSLSYRRWTTASWKRCCIPLIRI